MGEPTKMSQTAVARAALVARRKARQAQAETKKPYESPRITVRTDRSRLRNTEAGMPEAQRSAVLDWESAHTDNKREVFAVVTDDGTVNPMGTPMMQGRIIGRGSNKRFVPDRDALGNFIYNENAGKKSEVGFDPRRVPANSVLIHNHPDASKTNGISGGVGISLSSYDIRSAISTNAREIRARAKNYIYSLKRPAGGWGVSKDTAFSEWDRLYKKAASDIESTVMRHAYRGLLGPGDEKLYTDRINALASHIATKELAKRYGWRYTRRKA